jgi:uncharacterized protein YlxW (UPF0749 family)
MPFLKLHSYEPETEPPAPLSFQDHQGSWREANRETNTEEESVDSISQVERALNELQGRLDGLSEQVDDYCDPIPMSNWTDTDDDDGPWAA